MPISCSARNHPRTRCSHERHADALLPPQPAVLRPGRTRRTSRAVAGRGTPRAAVPGRARPRRPLLRRSPDVPRAEPHGGQTGYSGSTVSNAACRSKQVPCSGRRRRRPGGRRHVLCVSRHEFPKRTELFVEAAQHLDQWPAVCVGDGSRLASIRERARQADVSVRFVPHAPANELDDLYTDAACVVAPAFDEDYGLTALEAMAHGVPVVVCADGGGLTELVEDAGAGLVVPAEPEAIAEAARRIADDPGPGRAPRIGAGCRRRRPSPGSGRSSSCAPRSTM